MRKAMKPKRYLFLISTLGLFALLFIPSFQVFGMPKQYITLSDGYPPPNSQPTTTQNALDIYDLHLPIIIGRLSPKNTQSFYMWTISGVYTLGCDIGTQFSALAGSQNIFVFLDYGNPNQDSNGNLGTVLYNQTPITAEEIKSSVVGFALGFYYCSSEDVITISIGTNSSGGLPLDIIALSHGQAWANLVNEVNHILVDYYGVSSRIFAVGGINIEPGFNPTYIPIHWLNGYNSVYNRKPVYVIASADGCPVDYPNTEPEIGVYPPGNCNNGWTQEDIYYVSWGSSASWPYPEIYNHATADEWYRIGLYSKLSHFTMVFKGSMTQLEVCKQLRMADPFGQYCIDTDYDPATGFIDLYNEINADPYHRITNAMVWSTDMLRYYGP